MVRVDFNNRIRYKLDGRIIIDPIGFDNSDQELARNETYFGIVSQFSNNLIFVRNGADYITSIKNTYGINRDIILTKEEQNPQTDIWELVYTGHLDLSTYELENSQVSIKINSGGLEKLLKARESEQVEINRTTAIDGTPITEQIEEIGVSLKGKAIQLVSDWKSEANTPDNYCAISDISAFSGTSTSGIPFPIINNTEFEDQAILYGSNVTENVSSGDINGTVGQMFFFNSEKKHTLNVSLELDAIINNVLIKRNSSASIDIFIGKYSGGSSLNIIDKTILFNIPNKDVINWYNNKSIPHISYSGTFNLEIGESLGLIFQIKYVSFIGVIRVNLSNIAGTIKVTEDSFAPSTTMSAYLYKDLLKQLIRINTNSNFGFYSSYLANKLIGVSHGFFVRQFPKDSTYFKPLTTSIKDALVSLDSIEPIGMGIEVKNGMETVVVENIDYFFNQNVTIRIGQVSNVKRSIATEFYYSSLLFGSEKGGEYEEANGLDEFNTSTTYTTCITRLKKVYEKISKYRKDGTGKELARRKPFQSDPTTDTTYDNDIFLLDLKNGSYGLYEEKGSEQYTTITGIYSPETSNGFYFSAKQTLLRHAKMFSGTLEKEPNQKIRFGSSRYNSKLVIDGVAEMDDVLNSSLQRKLFTPEWIEFKYKVDSELFKLIKGKTQLNNSEVVNMYGLVEFINESGNKEKGYLFNLKPNGEGEWKLLKY